MSNDKPIIEGPILLDGLDAAIVGSVYDHWGMGVERLVYSRDLIIKVLINRDGMTADDADEFFEYNISGLYAGKGTPLYIEPYEEMLSSGLPNSEWSGGDVVEPERSNLSSPP